MTDHKDGIADGGAAGERFTPQLVANEEFRAKAKVKGKWLATCYKPDGSIRWEEEFTNIVVTEGLNYMLDIGLDGQTQLTTWYVGLKDTGTPVAGDTMGSHGSWATIVPYSDSVDPTWTGGTASAGSIDNSASKASFTIDAGDTIFGAFLKSNNTKGGTTGVLYAVGDFASSRAVLSGDTLEVTATFTMIDDA